MTLTIDEEMKIMCTLTEAVLQEGVEIGRVEGIEEGIEEGIKIGTVTTLVNNVKTLIRNLECGIDRAMDILSIEGPDREELARLVMESGE
jgi:predicted transposase YdaD